MKQFLKDKLAGRTQRWLCQKIGMTDVNFSNSVNGIHRQFRSGEWEKIVAVLELTTEDLQSTAVQNYPFIVEPSTP